MRAPIVGIGASAGGLEALSDLLGALPARPGIALVVVQHLDRTHESLLTDILSRRTALPVVEATDGLVVSPDHVYVIPPNATLTVADGTLHLSPRAPGREPHMPVDALFRSLAEGGAERAIGVVLSGADSDGSAGTLALKHAGGITFAQEPDSARIPSMPRNAIETGCVDFVLPPTQIANELVRLAAHPYLRLAPDSPVRREDEAVALGSSAEEATEEDEQSLRRVYRRLRTAHGVDFARYKPSTLRRRLARRMALQRVDGLSDYVDLLENDSAETSALYQDFLIRVTGFFRDPESFRVLREHVFPSLFAGRSPKEPIRIWVPGCATGEEVYSIAIALVEFLGEHPPATGFQIFGTDVSEAAIEKARAGSYLESIAEDVSAERLQHYFVKQNSHYLISRSIRDLCVFARQDVIRDPPFSRLDLVSCRNLLIYLGSAAQQRVMQIFHYALRPHGFLMLGPSEGIGQAPDLFESIDKPHRLYKPKPKPLVAGSGLDLLRSRVGRERGPSDSDAGRVDDFLEPDSALRQADRLILARYAPASILVDEALNILQFRGQTGPYLAPASGPPSLNLQRIGRPELLVEITSAVREARESGVVARRPALNVEGVGEVNMEVIPLQEAGAAPRYLILFEDESRRAGGRRERQAQIAGLTESEKDRRIAHLERESTELREFLQATMEQHEAAREALTSAHEEVLSANEEFQSTNEELETSKEELQSANEELSTTNEELRDRNRQLAVLNAELEKARGASERARAYADGIVETVREPLVVLDGELKIVRVNKAFCSELNLRMDDVENHTLDEVTEGQWDGPLRERLAGVLAGGNTFSDFEIALTQPVAGRRLWSLSARKIAADAERAGLLLLAIEDITERRARADTLREGSRRKDEFLAMLAHELRNPLGPITHAVHLLQRGVADPAKLYEMIERQTARLVRLVDELLDVARISRGLIELKREPVNVAPIVRNAADAVRPRIEQRKHALSLSLPEEPICVDGDAVRLEQVISNLLENAIKYTNPGGRIDVTLTAASGDAVLSVSDTGIGLETETLERIFDLFTQVDTSLARSGGGLGLGLTLVRRVLEMHGGRIEAHSAGLGQGSDFVVRIPLLTSSRWPGEREAPNVETLDTPRARRVLLVDDNEDSAESMAMLIRMWGHEVHVARDAKGALQAAESFSPETALVDIGLPDMDGYELARRLRAQPRLQGLHLVAMTGYGRDEDRKAARDAGFDLHLVKPAEPDVLARALEKGAAKLA